MILGFEPLDLRPLASAMRGLVELDDVDDVDVDDDDGDPTTAFFDDPDNHRLIARALEVFERWVYDNARSEPLLRRGVAYVLNLDDDRLLEVTSRLYLILPARAGIRRRFLRMLWDATFAPPEIPGFDPDAIEIVI